jgi:hypothetical protein
LGETVVLEVVLPVGAILMAALWRYFARPRLFTTAEDWSLSFDLLLGAAVLQGYFLGQTYIALDAAAPLDGLPASPQYHTLLHTLLVQITSLVLLVGVLPLLNGTWLRNSYEKTGDLIYQRSGGPDVYEELEELSWVVAGLATIFAGVILAGVFLLNYYRTNIFG